MAEMNKCTMNFSYGTAFGLNLRFAQVSLRWKFMD